MQARSLISAFVIRCLEIDLYLGVISMHFWVFSLGQGTEWGIFLGVAKISNIFFFLAYLNFLIFF